MPTLTITLDAGGTSFQPRPLRAASVVLRRLATQLAADMGETDVFYLLSPAGHRCGVCVITHPNPGAD